MRLDIISIYLHDFALVLSFTQDVPLRYLEHRREKSKKVVCFFSGGVVVCARYHLLGHFPCPVGPMEVDWSTAWFFMETLRVANRKKF